MNLVIRALLWLARKQEPRVIEGRNTDDPYLTRYYLTKRLADAEGMDRRADDAPKHALYLHRFHRSDDELELHNHPWEWAVSLILHAGYSEERLVGGRVVRRDVKPWTLNFIGANTFHRIDLVRGECWTLFIAGPIVQSWGFLDRYSKTFTNWKDFLLQ